MRILIALVLNALALIITALIVPGFHVSGFWVAILAAIILGLINTFIKPLLLFLTAPLNFLTLGLFTFVVNALVLEIMASIVETISPGGLEIQSFWTAVFSAIVLSVVSTILSMLLRDVQYEITPAVKKTRKSSKSKRRKK